MKQVICGWVYLHSCSYQKIAILSFQTRVAHVPTPGAWFGGYSIAVDNQNAKPQCVLWTRESPPWSD